MRPPLRHSDAAARHAIASARVACFGRSGLAGRNAVRSTCGSRLALKYSVDSVFHPLSRSAPLVPSCARATRRRLGCAARRDTYCAGRKFATCVAPRSFSATAPLSQCTNGKERASEVQAHDHSSDHDDEHSDQRLRHLQLRHGPRLRRFAVAEQGGVRQCECGGARTDRTCSRRRAQKTAQMSEPTSGASSGCAQRSAAHPARRACRAGQHPASAGRSHPAARSSARAAPARRRRRLQRA